MAASRQHKKATFLANISTIWAFERNQPRKKSRVIIMPPASLSPLSLPARKKSRFGGRGKMSSISVVHTLGDLSLTHSAGSEEEDQQRSKKRENDEGRKGKPENSVQESQGRKRKGIRLLSLLEAKLPSPVCSVLTNA